MEFSLIFDAAWHALLLISLEIWDALRNWCWSSGEQQFKPLSTNAILIFGEAWDALLLILLEVWDALRKCWWSGEQQFKPLSTNAILIFGEAWDALLLILVEAWDALLLILVEAWDALLFERLCSVCFSWTPLLKQELLICLNALFIKNRIIMNTLATNWGDRGLHAIRLITWANVRLCARRSLATGTEIEASKDHAVSTK